VIVVSITTLPPATSAIMPDARLLRSLRKIVAAACPWIDGVAVESEAAEREFKNAFWAQGRFFRLAEPDERRSFLSVVDDASEMLIAKGAESVSASMFLAACIGACDVVYRRQDGHFGRVPTRAR
jgi:hypothetical protein